MTDNTSDQTHHRQSLDAQQKAGRRQHERMEAVIDEIKARQFSGASETAEAEQEQPRILRSTFQVVQPGGPVSIRLREGGAGGAPPPPQASPHPFRPGQAASAQRPAGMLSRRLWEP